MTERAKTTGYFNENLELYTKNNLYGQMLLFCG